MRIFPEPIVFVWDSGNKDKNLKRHTVTNLEAEQVFRNTPFFVWQDIAHSQIEQRYQALGKTNKQRLLFVSFTVRNEHVRIISVRDMSKKERRVYEEKIKTNSSI